MGCFIVIHNIIEINISKNNDLDDFADEIDGWIIDELKAIGCDTAKSVLELTIRCT